MSSQRIIWALVLSQLLITGAGRSASTNSSVASGVVHEHQLAVDSDASDEGEAARRFVAHLEAVIAESIVPGIRRGVLAKSTTRRPALRVEVTDDPSPYHVGARVDSDGSMRVRLSLGYVTLHDAALDAVALSASLNRPEQLRIYLSYQLALARANEHRQASGSRRYRAMSFAEFARLDGKDTEALFSQDSFQRKRAQVEVNSLGWVVAYLLVKLDPRLAGASSSVLTRDGRAAATLAAASGWFPVPPVATALGLAEVAPAASSQGAQQSHLCRAARLIEEGVQILKVSPPWSSRLKRDAALQRQVAAIESDVARMRHDGKCTSAIAAAL
jgi:hypothetical protein